MRSNIKRIRIDYAPLNVAVSVDCLTPTQPALQVYDGAEYEPDREIDASVFCPKVVITAADGSWTNTNANSLLTEMHWYVNGEEISEHADWQGNNGVGNPKYSINTGTTSTRGAITIRKNVPQEKQYSLHFEGIIADTRLGARVPIVTDAIILSTEAKAEDAYSMSIGDDMVIQYNPFRDKLYLYDYKVAHGKISASSSAQSAATDENSYIRTIPVHLYKAGKEITTGYTIKLYKVNSVSSLTELTVASNPEVTSITPTAVTLDLRLINKTDFVVEAIISNSNRPNSIVQFSINRCYQSFNIHPTNGAGILPSDSHRLDIAMVDSDGGMVDCPESILKIQWYTDSAYETQVAHNEGERTRFLISKTGIGNTYNDDWLDVYCEAEIKEEHCVATDSDGNIFTDENGNPYIFN